MFSSQEYTTPTSTPSLLTRSRTLRRSAFMEREYRCWIRWNAAVQVTRAQRPGVSGAGHISSAARLPLYEVGLNHFFRGRTTSVAVHVFQGHASLGPARSSKVVRRADGRLPPAGLHGSTACLVPAPALLSTSGSSHGLARPGSRRGHLPGLVRPLPP